MEFLNDYLVLVVLGICLCVGYVIKIVFKNEKLNQFIPLIVAVLGVVVNLWASAWILTPDVLLGGLASGLASTGMYEMFRNFINVGNND